MNNHTSQAQVRSGQGTTHDNAQEDVLPTVNSRQARQRRMARPGRAPDRDGAAIRLATYVPGESGADQHLPVIRSLAAAADPVNPADAAELLTALAEHAAWRASRGETVDAESLLNPTNVQQWVLTGLAGMSPGSAANYRSRIARVAAATHGAPGLPAPLYASDGVAMYLGNERERLVDWASNQSSAAAAADLMAALPLLLGFGLSNAEMTLAKSGDLTYHPTGPVAFTLRVRGSRSRVVAADDGWGQFVSEITLEDPDAWLVFHDRQGDTTGRNALSNLVDRCLTGSGAARVRLTPQRTRATWLVRHMAAGTRLDLLLGEAGLDSPAVLGRYLPQVPRALADEPYLANGLFTADDAVTTQDGAL